MGEEHPGTPLPIPRARKDQAPFTPVNYQDVISKKLQKNPEQTLDPRLAQTICSNISIPTGGHSSNNNNPVASLGVGRAARGSLSAPREHREAHGRRRTQAGSTAEWDTARRDGHQGHTEAHPSSQHVPLVLPVLAPGPGDETTAR